MPTPKELLEIGTGYDGSSDPYLDELPEDAEITNERRRVELLRLKLFGLHLSAAIRDMESAQTSLTPTRITLPETNADGIS